MCKFLKIPRHVETHNIIVITASTTASEADLPPAAGVTGRIYTIKAEDVTNAVTVDPNAAETIDGASLYTFTAADQAITIQSDGTGWIILSEIGTAAANTDILNTAAITQLATSNHTLLDNQAAAVSFDAAGFADIFNIISTDASEGISTSGALTVTGTSTFNGDVVLGNANTDALTLASEEIILSNIQAFANMTDADAALPANTIWQTNAINKIGYQEGTLMISQN